MALAKQQGRELGDNILTGSIHSRTATGARAHTPYPVYGGLTGSRSPK